MPRAVASTGSRVSFTGHISHGGTPLLCRNCSGQDREVEDNCFPFLHTSRPTFCPTRAADVAFSSLASARHVQDL